MAEKKEIKKEEKAKKTMVKVQIKKTRKDADQNLVPEPIISDEIMEENS